MPSKFIPASQALQEALNQAYAALQRGDKREARRLAQVAASMQPDSEEPWLILGAAAQPHASLAYLKQALEINPTSERARGGLEWATRRLKEMEQPSRRMEEASATQVESPASHEPVVEKKKASGEASSKTRQAVRIVVPIVLLSVALLLVAAWTFRPGMGTPAAGAPGTSTSAPNGALPPAALTDQATQTGGAQPTETIVAAATPSPTAFQPAEAIPTAGALQVNTSPSVNGLREGEFLASEIPAGGEKSITVSLHEERLYAYQGGSLIATFIVSTGSNTRTGSFHILDKIPDAFSDIWNFRMPDWMGIYYAGTLENGFHALPVLPNGETIWSDALGTPVSYGCVVLGVPEAQALYDWAEVGTTVKINP